MTIIHRSTVVLGASLLLLVACIDSPTGPRCTETTLIQASVSGDTVTLNTGLRYLDVTVGTGTVAAEWCNPLATHFTEFLADGTRIGSSHDDIDQPLVFTPGFGDLIDGYEQGVIGMRQGGTRRLIVPPGLAYGSTPVRNGAGVIIVPANSTLIYDVEAVLVTQ